MAKAKLTKAEQSLMEMRVKTDVRLPRMLVQHVDEFVEQLGMTKNALFTIGAMMLVSHLLVAATPGKKRQKAIRDFEKLVQNIFDEAKKAM